MDHEEKCYSRKLLLFEKVDDVPVSIPESISEGGI
jgi:hypothetical protein